MRKILYFFMILSCVLLLAIPFIPNKTLTYQELATILTSLPQHGRQLQNINTCKKNFDFHTLDKNDFIYYLNEDAMDVDEILLVRALPIHQQDVITKFQHRIDSQKLKFNGYGAIQMEKLNQAKILTFDDCVLLIISNDESDLTLGGTL